MFKTNYKKILLLAAVIATCSFSTGLASESVAQLPETTQQNYFYSTDRQSCRHDCPNPQYHNHGKRHVRQLQRYRHEQQEHKTVMQGLTHKQQEEVRKLLKQDRRYHQQRKQALQKMTPQQRKAVRAYYQQRHSHAHLRAICLQQK